MTANLVISPGLRLNYTWIGRAQIFPISIWMKTESSSTVRICIAKPAGYLQLEWKNKRLCQHRSSLWLAMNVIFFWIKALDTGEDLRRDILHVKDLWFSKEKSVRSFIWPCMLLICRQYISICCQIGTKNPQVPMLIKLKKEKEKLPCPYWCCICMWRGSIALIAWIWIYHANAPK